MVGGNDGYSANQMCCWPGASTRDTQGSQKGTRHNKNEGPERRLKGRLEEGRAPSLPPSWAARMTFYRIGKFWHKSSCPPPRAPSVFATPSSPGCVASFSEKRL